MKVLIACEESQEVCKAFRAQGHEAYSCDLQPCSGGHPEWHIQEDAVLVINSFRFYTQDRRQHFVNDWDLLIAHPVCTRLANSGVLRLYKGGKKENGIDPVKWQDMIKAADFFKQFLYCHIPLKCIENPVPHGYAIEEIGRKYSQTIQPYQFGEDASKRTCLWLEGLPPLKGTKYYEPRVVNGKKRWSNQTDSGQNKLPPSEHRAKDRAKTYQGIAEAMAEQWGKIQEIAQPKQINLFDQRAA